MIKYFLFATEKCKAFLHGYGEGFVFCCRVRGIRCDVGVDMAQRIEQNKVTLYFTRN